MKTIAYIVLAIVTYVSCTKEQLDEEYPRHSDKEIIDTIHCNIIKNKGSLVTSVCNGDTITLINE